MPVGVRAVVFRGITWVMRRRIVEALVVLGLVAGLVSVVRKGPEPGTRASLEDLTIDRIYPGMAISEVDPRVLSPTTVFGTAGIHDNKRAVNFVYGETLFSGNTPYVQKGDAKQRVYQRLGRPDLVRDQVWTYEGAFALGFRDGRLSGIFSDQSYMNSMQDYYYIECNGLSHYPPNYFYALVGESATGDSALVLVPWLTLSTKRFFSACQTDQVILPSGRVFVGQSVQIASDTLSGNEVEIIEGRQIYTFADFTLALKSKGDWIVNIVVAPRPLNPEPNYEVEGILDLIEREP